MNSFSERERLRHESEQRLIDNISAAREDLLPLLEEVNGHWGYEDGVYRFYHQSFKVFLHARYFLEMTCRYADKIEKPQQLLPSGWASVLYLYGLR